MSNINNAKLNVNIDKNFILEALVIGRDAAAQIASKYHESHKGYRENQHKILDDDVILIDRAIEILTWAKE